MRKSSMYIIIAVVFLALLGAILWLGVFQKEEALEVHDKITPFELEDVMAEGTYSSETDTIKLISFIFINCPDGVCPMTMVDFHDLQEKLKEKGKFGQEVELITITFDPERDTSELLREYAEGFGVDPAGWRVLRGDPEAIQALSDELKFFYGFDGDNGFHSTVMFLVDGDHQVRSYHRMSKVNEPMDQEAILKDINKLLKEK